jgi:restriction endonuclease Mrr
MGYGISRQGRKQIRYTVDGKIDLLKIKNKKDFSGIIQKANKYFIKESSW